MKVMKTFLVMMALVWGAGVAYAQEEVTITDEELSKYATAMDSVNEMSASVMVTISDMVKNSTVMNAARYNDLSKIAKDEAKLAEAKATPEEIAFLNEVATKKEEETARINAAFQSLAKEYVGVAVFNKVKKALSADAELKTKYDSLMDELKKDNPVVQ